MSDRMDGYEGAEWERLYAGLLGMQPSGKFDDQGIEFDLKLVGLIEGCEAKKPCRNCGAPLLDYRYNKITLAGRIFMQAAAIASGLSHDK